MDAEAGTNLDVALGRAQAAKAAQPDDPNVSDTLGWVFVKRDMPSLAIPPLQHAVDKDPSNPLYHYHLGIAYSKADKKPAARSALERALSLSPNFERAADARQALASLR
jgi:Flp pilus assembly protein TadD